MSAAVRTGFAITGPTSATMSRSTPAGAQRHDDVGEEDRRVDVVAADRLQGDLAGHLGLETGRQHAVPFAQRPVFGQRTAGLPHEPHGHSARFAAGNGGQIGRLGKVATSTH